LPQLRSEWGASIAVQAKVQPPGVEDAAGRGSAHLKLKPGPGRSVREVSSHQRARIHSAMVEVIAEHGYDATTVRRLARKAGVSTRTFYQHYSGKEECFLRTQELIAHLWTKRIGASQGNEESGEKGILRGARALLHAWFEWPEAARLMLVDAYSAGPRALYQARNSFHEIAVQCYAPGVTDNDTSGLISEGIIAGMAGVVGSRLLHGRSVDVEDQLLNWVASCCPALSFGISGFPTDFKRPAAEFSRPISSSNVEGEDGALAPKGDRALLLSAVSKLASTEQADILTPRKISEVAGVSQRKFYVIFPGLSECLIAAVEWHAEKAISKIRQQRGPSIGLFNDTSRSVALLCAQISREPALANLCFGELGIASAERLRCQERVVAALRTLIPEASCRIAADASASAVWNVLSSEAASRKTAQLSGAVPILTYLLLAPTSRTSWATEKVVDPSNHVAAA
jgi:AcrR family transcriptional regulator